MGASNCIECVEAAMFGEQEKSNHLFHGDRTQEADERVAQAITGFRRSSAAPFSECHYQGEPHNATEACKCFTRFGPCMEQTSGLNGACRKCCACSACSDFYHER